MQGYYRFLGRGVISARVRRVILSNNYKTTLPDNFSIIYQAYSEISPTHNCLIWRYTQMHKISPLKYSSGYSYQVGITGYETFMPRLFIIVCVFHSACACARACVCVFVRNVHHAQLYTPHLLLFVMLTGKEERGCEQLREGRFRENAGEGPGIIFEVERW